MLYYYYVYLIKPKLYSINKLYVVNQAVKNEFVITLHQHLHSTYLYLL